MEPKITFKKFFSTMRRGVWQGICWVGAMFGFNDETRYGKVVRRVFASSLALIAVYVAVALSIEFIDYVSYEYRHKYKDQWLESYLSPNFAYYRSNSNRGYILNLETKEKTVKDITWLCRSEDGDSLAVFKTGDRRGYLNRYTGRVQIPARYDKAWVFSSGVACVQNGRDVFFIDHNGNKLFDKPFIIPRNSDGYFFKGGYCAMESETDDLWGLIDKQGDWVLEPKYSLVSFNHEYFWIIADAEGKMGVFDKYMNLVLPVEYLDVSVDSRDMTIYATKDGCRKKYDRHGNIVEDFVVYDTDCLYYEVMRDDEGDSVMALAPIKSYYVRGGGYGLLSNDGKPITKAIYSSISAVNANLYECSFEYGEAIYLDSKGNKVNK